MLFYEGNSFMKYMFRYIFFLALVCVALTACDAMEEVPHEHTVESWQMVESPTCTETGLASGNCSVCHVLMDTILPTVSHTLTKTVVSPTCTEEGLFNCNKLRREKQVFARNFL